MHSPTQGISLMGRGRSVESVLGAPRTRRAVTLGLSPHERLSRRYAPEPLDDRATRAALRRLEPTLVAHAEGATTIREALPALTDTNLLAVVPYLSVRRRLDGSEPAPATITAVQEYNRLCMGMPELFLAFEFPVLKVEGTELPGVVGLDLEQCGEWRAALAARSPRVLPPHEMPSPERRLEFLLAWHGRVRAGRVQRVVPEPQREGLSALGRALYVIGGIHTACQRAQQVLCDTPVPGASGRTAADLVAERPDVWLPRLSGLAAFLDERGRPARAG